MGQLIVPERARRRRSRASCPGDLAILKEGGSLFAAADRGRGIVDDLMVTRRGDHFYWW
jgi:hypothetical protein